MLSQKGRSLFNIESSLNSLSNQIETAKIAGNKTIRLLNNNFTKTSTINYHWPKDNTRQGKIWIPIACNISRIAL